MALNYRNIPLTVVDGDPENKVPLVPSRLMGSDEGRSKSMPSYYSRKHIQIFNQGQEGTCVGHSGKVVADDVFNDNLSALWIYKTAQDHDEWLGSNYEGTSIVGACRGLMKKGVCLDYLFPFTIPVGTPRSGASLDAKRRRINNFYRVDDKVHDYQTMILKAPLWTSMDLYDSFYKIQSNGIVYSDYFKTGKSIGGHAVAVTGWKHIGGKLHFELQNSWGTRWGDRGMFYMEPSLFFSITHGSYFIDTEKKKVIDYIVPAENQEIDKGPFSILQRIISSIFSIFKRF
jgi:hypothetical protein